MEIDKGELEELLQKQAKMAGAEAVKQTERYMGTLVEDFTHKLDVAIEAARPIADVQVKLGVISQDVEILANDVSAVKEIVPVVRDIQKTFDSTFEKVGELTVDMETAKEVIKSHEERLHTIEAR